MQRGGGGGSLQLIELDSPSTCYCRYEWVDVGMLEYNPTSKLYLVKRVHVPSHILEEAASREKDKEEKGACEVQSSLCVDTSILTCTSSILLSPYHIIPLL